MADLIIICGFMGSGKSTFAKRLSENDSWCHGFDLDREINQKYNKTKKSFGDWISFIGMDQFRELETQGLQNIVNEYCDRKIVLALGGGSLSVNNLKFLREKKAFLVWMNTPFKVCFERIKNDSNRPLVARGEDFLENIHKERSEIYKESDLILNSVDQDKILCVGDLF